MKKLISVVCTLLVMCVAGNVDAKPWEVLHEISFIKKGGIDAVRIDFAIPVHYVSHAPAKHGNHLTVKIRFDRDEVPDTSDLPIMQSLYAPQGSKSPLIDVIYQTEKGEPQLQVNFKSDVHFSVSQVMGITSLIIFLPDSAPKKVAKPKVSPLPSQKKTPAASPPQEKIPVASSKPQSQPPMLPEAHSPPDVATTAETADSKNDIKAKQLFNEGRRALRTGKYNTAVQVFSAILSLPPNKYTRSALEFLGITRERNHQNAHAKAIYEQYLDQYPEGEGSVRVRQRLAELLANQLKPKRKLAESPREKREGKKDYISEFVGNLSQYVYYGDTSTESSGRTTDYTFIDTQMSLNWRVRSKDWDVNNYFFGNVDYDTVKNESDGLEVSSAYSKIKNRKMGLYASLGRQFGTNTGVLGRFDGAYLGYDILPKVRINGVFGYPVDIIDKQTIQTNKPMVGIGLDFSGFLKGWDASPYYIQQNVDGIIDRRAVGADIQYFEEKLNFLSSVDYDLTYSDINMFSLQGQYFYSKPTTINFYYDYRANPLLATSNALLQLSEDVTIKDLLDGTKTSSPYTESQLQTIAADRTGHSSITTLGFSQVLNPKNQLTADITHSELTTKLITTIDPIIDNVLATSANSDVIREWDASVQLVSSKVFGQRDSLINAFLYQYTQRFSGARYRLEYHWPYELLYTVEPRITLRYRKTDTGEILFQTIPAIRVNYRSSKNLRFYLDANLEIGSFSGKSNQEDYRRGFYYFGYNWTF